MDFSFAVGAQGVKLLRPNPCWQPKFFVYLLSSLDLPDRGYSRHFQFVRQLFFPLPPLAEQHRIVEAIETQFTRLDAAVAALEHTRTKLKRHRAAVLAAACSGRLVPTEAELARVEGRDYEPAAHLIERACTVRPRRRRPDQLSLGSLLDEPSEQKVPDGQRLVASVTARLGELPEGWTWVRLRQIGDVKLGRQRAPQHHSGSHMRPYLRVANVYEARIDVSHVLQMNFTPEEYESFRLEYGDILLNEGQSLEWVGRPAMFRNEIDGACFQNTLVRFRASNAVDRRFALVVFRTFLHTGAFRAIAKWTVNIAHLGADRFANMAFPLPPLGEQHRIVAEVERRLSVVDELEATVAVNLKRADRMRQAILRRAFAGRLVPQDPDDEPASALLERIQAERTARSPDRGPTRRRLRPMQP